MMVSQKEIIEALRHVGCSSGLDVRHALANRIEAEGIAPPDGMVLVPSKPTVEMLNSAMRECGGIGGGGSGEHTGVEHDDFRNIWDTMLAAAQKDKP